MRNYLTDMKHVMGLAAILVTLLAGMTFVVAGNAAVVPPNNNVAVGTMAVVQSAVPPTVLGANAKSALNPAINNAAFVRPAFNPFFARPAFNPFFFRPFFNPFFGFEEPFGAFEGAAE